MQIEWSPGVGDPHLVGWLTALCYVACAAYCLVVCHRAERIFAAPVLRQKALWLGLALLMLFLGINKQLDLQSLLTEIGRLLAKRQGWYENRRSVQRLFVLGLTGGAAVTGVLLLWVYRKVFRAHRFAIAGVFALSAFVLYRASGFLRVELPLDLGDSGIWFNAALELVGIFLVAWNARQLTKRDGPRAPGD